MALKGGVGFSSDGIKALVGFEGSENKDLVKWFYKNVSAFPCRVACAINQSYPELKSGFYLNKAVVASVQDALLDIGLHVVIEDNYNAGGVTPEEAPGCIEASDDYLLVDSSMRICGRLRAWESHGGKSAFYHDNYILDLLSDDQRMGIFLDALEKRCLNHRLAFTKKMGSRSPQHVSSVLQRICSRWF